MAKATKKQRKPYPDFPLTAHRNGQWCKKIRGKLHYFGTEAEAALQKYVEERDDLQAGRTPHRSSGALPLADMINLFLSDQDDKRKNGDLSPLSFRDYKWVGEQMLANFGRNVDPTQLKSKDFTDFRRKMSKYAPSRLTKTVTVCKMMFNWAYDQEHIEKVPRWGKEFKGASKKQVRVARAKAGQQSFEADEILELLKAAKPQMKLMILLGINCGYGNSDLSRLPLSAIRKGWADFPRPKTGIERMAPLWPETLEALGNYARAEPAEDNLSDRVLLTSRGTELVAIDDEDGSRIDKVTIVFRNLMKQVGCYRKGRSFYGLRHTFQTIGDGSGDDLATSYIMGHADDSMAAVYREHVFKERLINASNYVRKWLYIFPKRLRLKWTIICSLTPRYWTGDSWSAASSNALTFESEDEAKRYIATNQGQLLADLFDAGDDKPATIPMRRQNAG